MKTTNRFIAAALEELSQEVGPTVAVTTPAVSNGNTDGTAVKVNIDDSADAVAELMEKNSELIDANATLESESFDNDLDAIEASSDTVTSDLDDAVAAGIALEQLVGIIDVSVRNQQVTPTAVAGFAMALEQISHRAKLDNPIPALEAETLQLEGPTGQAKSIGAAAAEKAGELAKRLGEAIKRVIGWLLGMLRSMFAQTDIIAARAKKARTLLDSIDESKTIDSTAFITSLRLIEGAGDPTEQFNSYAKMAGTTLYGFFNASFVRDMQDVIRKAKSGSHDEKEVAAGIVARSNEIIKVLLSTIYTENGSGADVSARLSQEVDEKDLTVGKTQPCVGGVQLYLAATLDKTAEDSVKFFHCSSGLVKTAPATITSGSIPVATKHGAKAMLGHVEEWMRDQRRLEQIFGVLRTYNWLGQVTLDMASVKAYLQLMTALASGCVPHLIRLNLKNSAAFCAYVEKSAAVSRGEAQA
jgi:hypothetical protein